MKLRHLLAPLVLLPSLSMADTTVSICDINMDNSYKLDKHQMEIVSDNKTYRIKGQQISIDNHAIELAQQQSQQLGQLEHKMRSLLPKVMQRELISAQQQLKGVMMERLSKAYSAKVDGQKLQQLVKQTMGKLTTVVDANKAHINYSPKLVDQQLEVIQQSFIASLSQLVANSTETESTFDINLISEQMSADSKGLQGLNYQICGLVKTILTVSEQVKTDAVALKKMQLVKLETVVL